MSARSRNIVLIAAAAVLALALVLRLSISEDPRGALARELSAYGYALEAEDLYVLAGARDTTIEAVLRAGEQAAPLDLAPALAASLEGGFPSDVSKTGDVTVLLADTERGVVTIYLLDGTIELCFLQTAGGEVLPIR